MARYVLVQFDNNEDAEDFVRALDEGTEEHPKVFVARPHPTLEGHYSMAGLRGLSKVLGLFFKPTLFCDCDPRVGRAVRGEKYGLMIHNKCGKPRRDNWQYPKSLLPEPVDFGPHPTIKVGQPIMLGFHEPLININAEGA